jgi:hypothetical protein
VTRTGELGTILAATSVVTSSAIHVTLTKEAVSSSETAVFTRTTRPNIPKDGILHSHLRGNFKSYRVEYRFAEITMGIRISQAEERMWTDLEREQTEFAYLDADCLPLVRLTIFIL